MLRERRLSLLKMIIVQGPRSKRNRSSSCSSLSAPAPAPKKGTDNGEQEALGISKHFELRRPAAQIKSGKKARGYAAPSQYQHLHHLPDLIAPNLDVLFCGSNPGCQSAKISHYYGHRSNRFWKSLFLSGFTPDCLSPYDDQSLPSKFGLGLTDLVSRPTAEANELSPLERLQGVAVLLQKIRSFQPRFLCFVGIKQYADLCSYLKKKLPKSDPSRLSMIRHSSDKKKKVGLQNIVFKSRETCTISEEQCKSDTTDRNRYRYTFVFVCPSTSALVRNYPVSLLLISELFKFSSFFNF
ncbi:hypothetical protein PtA15_3A738 [Puccinia triticina]|uniref:Uracil-DNA glycosylase-like domain-containing protein n=1 Tax=Puccinia triticina TaxID=208348 RepID=A0ABY7CG74_9BASI|nr:uncharacterized protein PtA15_3A738 [Puccinia triticina]WAQ83368.1 hypothetical protein PtA15_3A738 [Puccinia triticina]